MPFSPNITCCYLYPITKYGYPPPAQDTLKHIEEMKNLGFQSIELEGIRETHLLQIYDQRFAIKEKLDQWQLQVPYFCAVLPGLGS
ncbi:MAG: sugar phosphate isomerase/epimerase, partial [Bacteroidetes bacterium]|nr:sugar phosphate isomerase/epimerase [Bacteroidota bacterium]